MKSLTPLSFTFAYCLAFIALPLHAETPQELFRNNDRWAVVGDSITQNGSYYAWVYLYYITRFPELNIEPVNCGISGDTASGAVRRYPWDIQAKKPTVATVMFGMNDVSRNLYLPGEPTAETLAKREAALAHYRTNMTDLAKCLKADGARLVFVTPSPYDDTAQMDAENNPGVNAALATCGKFMAELAASLDATVVDLHGPMTELNQRLQQENPNFTLIGSDRIHPGALGHLVMAYYFLKGVGAPGLVSSVEVDASGPLLVKAANAEVKELVKKDGVLEFTVLEKALPYPIPSEARRALTWVDFQNDLNQEILKVTGLPPGRRTLLVDGQSIGEYDAEEFARGINLATNRLTPQARQADKVLELVRRWREAVAEKDRGIAQVEHFPEFKDFPRPISLEATQGTVDQLLAKRRSGTTSMDKYFVGILERYLKVKPLEEQSKQEIAGLLPQIREAAKPVPHRYEVR